MYLKTPSARARCTFVQPSNVRTLIKLVSFVLMRSRGEILIARNLFTSDVT